MKKVPFLNHQKERKGTNNLQIEERRKRVGLSQLSVIEVAEFKTGSSVTELDGDGRVGWAPGYQCLII